MGFLTGIQAYGKAFGLLFSRRFWWFLLFPVVTLMLLFVGGNLLVSYAGEGLYGLIEDWVRGLVDGISWLAWVGDATNIFIRIVLKVVYFFLFIAFGGYIVLIIMSPVYSWLSERTEAYLTGREYPFSWRELVREIVRGILIALRNMFVQLLLSVFFFFFSFVPVVGVVSPFAIFFISAYFYGFSFVDYTIERKKFNVRDSVRYVNRNIGMVTGVGLVFALSLMMPWVSMAVCSFVSILSVMAGTVAVNQLERGGQTIENR